MAAVNDEFAEFARGFRERTAARLLEFEKAMAQAQDELEKSAEKATARARMNAGQAASASEPRQHSAFPAHGKRRGSGQIKSVLRRKQQR